VYKKDLWNSTLYKYVYNVVQYTAINYFPLLHCRHRRRLCSSSQLLRVVCCTYIGVYYTLCVCVCVCVCAGQNRYTPSPPPLPLPRYNPFVCVCFGWIQLWGEADDTEGELGVPDEITRKMWWPGAPVVWLPVCRRRHRLVDNTRRVSHPLFSIVGRYTHRLV